VKVEQYFTVYETYHRHPQNKLCHYVGIPLIVYAVLNLLYQIPHLALGEWQVDFALLVAVAVIGFYVSLSLKLALAMTLSIVPLYLLAVYTPWQAGLAAFVVGWVFQFVGHHLEGKSPAFLGNALHLLIGPLWIISHVLEKLHLWTPRRAEAAP
jgi:uncharacterized membrane protein YGL010W